MRRNVLWTRLATSLKWFTNQKVAMLKQSTQTGRAQLKLEVCMNEWESIRNEGFHKNRI